MSATTIPRVGAMATTVAKRLESVERKALKCGLDRGDAARKKVSSDRCDDGQLVATAMEKSGLTRGQAAHCMGISEGLLSRQIDNADNQHLSWQRLSKLPNAFWCELWMLVAERRKLARVHRRVVFEVSA